MRIKRTKNLPIQTQLRTILPVMKPTNLKMREQNNGSAQYMVIRPALPGCLWSKTVGALVAPEPAPAQEATETEAPTPEVEPEPVVVDGAPANENSAEDVAAEPC